MNLAAGRRFASVSANAVLQRSVVLAASRRLRFRGMASFAPLSAVAPSTLTGPRRREFSGEASSSTPASVPPSGPGAAAAGPAKGAEPLICGKQTNVGIFAGAISKRVAAQGWCVIDAVGPEAGYNALKSVCIAGTYMSDFLGERHLVVTPEKAWLHQRTAPSGGFSETAMLRFHVWPLAVPTCKDGADPEMWFSSSTNPGNAAGLMRRAVQDRGWASAASMGVQSAEKAIKTIMIAQTYLAEYLEGRSLGATFRLERFQDEAEEKVRIVLSCSPVPSPPSLETAVAPGSDK
mmetsp:Transcript_130135/g.417596  ORF Transcript_130135/g.417596 Transcript_130135/m.417596 type:complete len:292 (+) Transcript_130135:58-933(+)|eukprot:CAMPEP_0204109410 /NCGR_PEP_ID=MMETSP0361-20130328/1272_1 /ASSEMBLY_ACC=CAM_ASM_000343 /TAXON_ID=268821 /ORGANISM="Scrippsiella Hangoei, Strain SHTV-5" /LENGTH=291 /DNA_ID=CAMNT_0051059161 /DNA_START=24 /DNA_END=899 /DNA_ORIENTATION=+